MMILLGIVLVVAGFLLVNYLGDPSPCVASGVDYAGAVLCIAGIVFLLAGVIKFLFGFL